MTPIHFMISGLLATSSAAALAANDIWKLTAFLCMGASLGILWSCLSKEAKEEVRITRARIIAGVVGGVMVPRLFQVLSRAVHWEIDLDSLDPLIIGGVGFFFSIGGFYAMHTGLRRFETRQKAIGALLGKTVEKTIANALGQPTPSDDENGKTSSH